MTAACAATLIAAGCGSGGTRPGSGQAAPERRPADPATCSVRHGTVVENHLMSQVLGQQRFRVYLPPGYRATAAQRYPVLYLFHGSSADETQWEDVGIGQGSDCLLAAHRMHPALIVLLDASTAERHGAAGASEVERFMADSVVPAVDRRFRTLADRRHRAIGGISLGGGWALRIAADRPDRFSAVGGHSPSTGLTLSQRASLARRQVRIWLDVGLNDRLRLRVGAFQQALRQRGADVTLHVWPGIHDRRYWSHHVQDYLRFYAARW